MGYTHYFQATENASKKSIKKMQDFVRKMDEITRTKIISSHGEDDEPLISDDFIIFNGVGDDGHEDFHIAINTGCREFCKTNRKPYDRLVVACLFYGHKHGVLNWYKSDGDSVDHGSGRALFRKVEKLMGESAGQVSSPSPDGVCP